MGHKNRSLISDAEMVAVLEIALPKVREFQRAITDLGLQISEWDEEALESLDQQLRANRKSARQMLREQSVQHYLFRLQDFPVGSYVPSYHGFDLGALLEVSHGLHSLVLALDGVQKRYSMPYQILNARLIGKSVLAHETNNLQMCYGEFTQAYLRLIDSMKTVAELTTAIMQNQPEVCNLCEAVLQAALDATYVREALIALNHSHQDGFDFVRKPEPVF